MHTDPMPYIIFAGLLGAAIGFFGCGIFASHKIRRANFEGYKEGLNAGKRAMAESMIDKIITKPSVRITPDGRAHYSPTELGLQSASSR